VTIKTLLVSLLLILMAGVAGAAPSRRSGFVTVKGGVTLHYLEWNEGKGARGGSDEVLLLLAGFGNDGTVFDTFAPKFTDKFRVFALTRRGFGGSDKPATGYDLATRVQDIRAFLDARGIRKASLVGHSLAGDELTAFASAYPDRVDRLVYLDAAYNRSRKYALPLVDDPSATPAQKKLMLEALGSPRAATIVDTNPLSPQERAIRLQIMKASLAFDPDYRQVRAPALALYATQNEHPRSAREPNAKVRDRDNAWWRTNAVPVTRASIDEFRREARRGDVVEMPHANHFLFVGATEAETVWRTREFLLR
jgi:non-heme chloroperoxidase